MLAAIFEMTVYMTITALILLLFKRIFKNKLSAKWQVWIWALLLVRLVVPNLPQSDFSIFNAVNMPAVSYEDGQKQGDAQEIIVNDASGEAESVTSHPMLDDKAPAEAKKPTLPQIASAVWVIGALLLLVYLLSCYILCVYRIRSYKEADNQELQQLLLECCEMIGVKKKVRLRMGGDTPLLTGLFNPCIVLTDGYSTKEYRDVIIHELCHLKSNDLLIIWLAAAVLCLNWFNPVMWYSFFALRRDIEVYCDSRAVEFVESKKDYAGLLLKTALRKNRFVVGTTALQNGEKEVERRIKHLAYFKKPKVLWSIVAALLAVVISALCLTNSFANCEMSDERQAEFKDRLVGSVMAEIAYADEERVVFYYTDGLFVYDLGEQMTEAAYDISRLNCETHRQGSSGLEITVTDDGQYAYLVNYGLQEEIKDFDNYILNLETGKVKTTDLLKPENPFKGLGDTFTLENVKGWFSNLYAETKQSVIYLTVLDSRIGSLKIVIRDKASGEEQDLYPFKAELNNTAAFLPKDIKNIASAQLITSDGGNYVLDEGAKLKRLEEILGKAQKTGASACPFDAKLILTRADGSRGVISLATDSCSQFVSGNSEYFDYEDGSSAILTLFGLSDWRQNTNDKSFYNRVNDHMFKAFSDKYSQHYEILDLSITHWEEISPTEARFFYKMTHKNFDKDPDTVPYIKEAKERGEYIYETYKTEYLEPKTGTYDLKAVEENGEIVIYANVAGKGEQWQLFDVNGGDKTEYSLVAKEDNRAFEWPCPASFEISRSFTGEYNHQGVDIKAEKGSPVVSATAGTVTAAEFNKEMGNYIEISDGAGTVSRYAHLDEIFVSKGDKVGWNMVIGKVGQTGTATGPHLHFEIKINETMIDPMVYF